ncbi:type II toxin-antitoxin system HicB family antitoxin [Pseudomonas sp. MWU12-3091]
MHPGNREFAWRVEMPDLPGCFSTGAPQEQAIEMVSKECST